MFRKPKRKVKTTLRKKDHEEEEDSGTDAVETDSPEPKRSKQGAQSTQNTQGSFTGSSLHSFAASDAPKRDLVTSTVDHHPEELLRNKEEVAEKGEDGIFRDTTRNKFHAGPVRVAAHLRVTARFDYQPDVCKDYKETGFCGFGDTCIYLHDRGDTLTGWQLEQQWEEERKKKKEKQEKEMKDFAAGSKATRQSDALNLDDGIPFACHICRKAFTDPVVTTCEHYFCEKCIFAHVRESSEKCPVCGKETHLVFNRPTKLMAKQRKLLGHSRSKQNDAWQQYLSSFQDAHSVNS